MKRVSLVLRGLRFHWRIHVGVLLGVAVSTAVLSGALFVGDSVRYTLRAIALERVGQVAWSLSGTERFFREALAGDLQSTLDSVCVPVLQLDGTALKGDGTARVNRLQVLGVDNSFWQLAEEPPPLTKLDRGKIVLSQRTADQLQVEEGDEIILRVAIPSLLPPEAPLSKTNNSSHVERLVVQAAVNDRQMGRFSLRAEQTAPYNAFVPLDWLQSKVELERKVNLFLIAEKPGQAFDRKKAETILNERWTLDDAGFEIVDQRDRGYLEIRSKSIFFADRSIEIPGDLSQYQTKILTYFANRLICGERITPYSIVSAIDRPLTYLGYPAQAPLTDREIIINQWLAEDLQAQVGDTLTVEYFEIGPQRKLVEKSRDFTVRAVVPMIGKAVDPELMPNFPGLKDSENCRDWEPGIPVETGLIRDKDEDYWDRYRGAPKAFVNLNAGRELWSNRFGDLTAVRYDAAGINRDRLKSELLHDLRPEKLGIYFLPVKDTALAAGRDAMDFGSLFLGLSLFLMVAAVILLTLFFVLGIEQRAEEIGTLLALGFPVKTVKRLFYLEGLLLSVLGSFLGIGLGLLYTAVMVWALHGVWSGAVAGAAIRFHVDWGSIGLAYGLGVLIGVWAVTAGLRRPMQVSVQTLLAGDRGERPIPGLRCRHTLNWSYGAAGMLAISALALIWWVERKSAEDAAGIFFGAGTLGLLSGLFFCHGLLKGWSGIRRSVSLDIRGLGIRNCSRRRGRSLAVIGLLACGGFLTIAVGANRQSPVDRVAERTSGTGGFALWGESALPLYVDLNTDEGCQEWGLSRRELEGVSIVPLRVHDGDDASCLNLNRPQSPRILALDPQAMLQRNAFTFAQAAPLNDRRNPWSILDDPTRFFHPGASRNMVPAFTDRNTMMWSLRKSLCDYLEYLDGQGKNFAVRLDGVFTNSIFQGNLVIAESCFVEKFPKETGYRVFLIDVPADRVDEVRRVLTFALQDIGLELTPTSERLASFAAVENTYLSIFWVLGALGILLGSVGLGVIVLRNVLERRSELAMLNAIGFDLKTIYQMILWEHWILLLLGLGWGCAAGLAAVFPNIMISGTVFPIVSVVITIVLLVGCGLLWVWLATAAALRGPLLSALMND